MSRKIQFQVNLQRMLETVCWFSKRSDGEKIGIHALMKILFFADVKHLNKYYLPILGGNYVALKYGPVHSQLYDVIKGNDIVMDEVQADRPFVLEGHEITALRPPNEKKFSKANLLCLESAWQEHRGKAFMELTEASHRYPAWGKAWSSRANNSAIMAYEDFFDHEVDKEILEDLVTYGRAIAV